MRSQRFFAMLKSVAFPCIGDPSSLNLEARTRKVSPDFLRKTRKPLSTHGIRTSSLSVETSRSLASVFNPNLPIEEAVTPPSEWYTDLSFYSLELDRVFYRGWQHCLSKSNSRYLDPKQIQLYDASCSLGNMEYVVCRDNEGKIHALHNVCRHHASVIASGTGQKSCLVCPYHGWTYGLDGALIKATRSSANQQFDSKEFGLLPIRVGTWGPFVLINLEKDVTHVEANLDSTGHDWLGSCSDILTGDGVDSSLSYLCRREYIIDCNWKVFCDNYLDGGYHVPYAHRGLASGLKLESYTTEIYEKVSIQRCESTSTDSQEDYDRLGTRALYTFVYPNFMINRYGPWMDTNLVVPLGPRKCKVVFDYFLDESLKDDKTFIESSLEESEKVQVEDIRLCEGVQRGLESPAYCTGIYVAELEKAMYHFHCLLHQNLIK